MLIGNGSASSFTLASPSARRARIARRVGSARAANVLVSWSTAIEYSSDRFIKLLVDYGTEATRRSEGGSHGKDRGYGVRLAGRRHGGPGGSRELQARGLELRDRTRRRGQRVQARGNPLVRGPA